MKNLKEMVGKQFHTVSSMPCWTFCRIVLASMDLPVPESLESMRRIDAPRIGAVVLFRQKEGFHAGVIYDSAVHFWHVRHPLNQPDHPPLIRQDRLSDPLYREIIDGYYVYGGPK